MAEAQRFIPKTKHISLNYHWFRSYTKGPKKIINIKYVNTKEQVAVMFIKPLDESAFPYLGRKANGW